MTYIIIIYLKIWFFSIIIEIYYNIYLLLTNKLNKFLIFIVYIFRDFIKNLIS